MTATDRPAPARSTAVPSPAAKRRRRGPGSSRLASIGLGVGLIVVWDLVVRTGLVDRIIIPFPVDVVRAMGELLGGEGEFWHHAWITTLETLVGFVVGSVVGLSLGALLGTSAWVHRVCFPYVVAFQGLPKVVLAPVFVTALGFGIGSKIAMAVVLAFFPVLINTMVGLTSVEPEQIKFMRSYGASPWMTFRKLTLPNAVPFIFAGLKTSLTFALIGAIVGEFVGAADGLGFLLNLYAYQLRIPEVWAIMAFLALLGVVLYGAIELVDRRIVFWRREQNLTSGM